MKLAKNCCFLLGIFLLLFQKSLAQRGYNYGRPGLSAATAGANVGANIPPAAQLRPIVPTGNAATATGYGTAPTAFGAPGAANAVTQGATAFGAFPAQVQRPLSPTVATNAFGGTAPTGLLARPTPTQRTAAGLFGGNLGRAQTTQFAGAAGSGIGGGGTATGAGDEGEGDYSAIPGVPGVDYPLYSQVPTTSFDCAQQELPGYYSDVEAQCQVFHICALNRTYSFLCPNGTIFSQEVLVCVWWNQYDCASAPALYANNAFIYDYSNRQAPADAGNGYQVAGIGATVRPQTNFPLATNAARTASSATTAQSSGIFGNSLGLRPTVTSGGGFGGFTTPITPAPTAAFGSRIPSGRIAAATPLPPQTFPNAAAIIPGSAIGNIGPTAAAEVDVAGEAALQSNALQTAQLATSSTNRQYLPPARRP